MSGEPDGGKRPDSPPGAALPAHVRSEVQRILDAAARRLLDEQDHSGLPSTDREEERNGA